MYQFGFEYAHRRRLMDRRSSVERRELSQHRQNPTRQRKDARCKNKSAENQATRCEWVPPTSRILVAATTNVREVSVVHHTALASCMYALRSQARSLQCLIDLPFTSASRLASILSSACASIAASSSTSVCLFGVIVKREVASVEAARGGVVCSARLRN